MASSGDMRWKGRAFCLALPSAGVPTIYNLTILKSQTGWLGGETLGISSSLARFDNQHQPLDALPTAVEAHPGPLQPAWLEVVLDKGQLEKRRPALVEIGAHAG